MKKAIPLVLFVMCSFLPLAFAEPVVRAEVDKKSLTTDEALTYKVFITSSGGEQISNLKLPGFEGFEIVSQSQSSTVVFEGEAAKTNLEYVLILVPLAKGTLKIPASSVKINEKIYSSESFTVEVTQGKLKPKLAPPERLEKERKPRYNI